jgi:hypothetical protein
MPAEAEAPTQAQFLAVRLFPSRLRGTRSSFRFLPTLTHSVCCACCIVSGCSSSSGARAGGFVRCDLCHVMTWCVSLSARACGLIALQCTLCAFIPTLAHLRCRVGVVGVGDCVGGGQGETVTWIHRSSVAQLSPLHSRYSHRTPREGVRFLSGGGVIVGGTFQDDRACR